MLILNNGVLRDEQNFHKAQTFNPDRWTPELEKSFMAIMWNQGPQRCPAKEICISLVTMFVQQYLALVPRYHTTQFKGGRVPQMLNPFTITIKSA